MLSWSVSVVMMFEIWYAVAYGAALAQLREGTLFLQVAHALLLIAAFGYLMVVSQAEFSLLIFALLLIAAMLLLLLWQRTPGNLPRLLRSYPRGIVDVLLFRRPKVADLKRRVRTK
ncbi:MAG: hypothetical protein WCF99_15190 [Chloroflexales bacterium]